MAYLTHYPGIFLEGPKQNTINYYYLFDVCIPLRHFFLTRDVFTVLATSEHTI
jgi:hypothetical protein